MPCTMARIIVVCLLIVVSVPPAAGELAPDAHTLLLLRANGDALGVDGETPVSAGGLAYADGVAGQGLDLLPGAQLHYAAAGNIGAAAGTIEFWLKPHWNGNDGQGHVALAWGTWGGVLVVKDGADNLRLIINRWSDHGLPERGAGYNVGGWTAGQWHHCAFTWDNAEVRCYADGVLRSGEAVGFTLPSPGNATFQVGAEGTGEALDGVIDELRISDVARTAAEIEASYLAGLAASSLTATPTPARVWATWPVRVALTAQTPLGSVTIPQSAATWTTSDAGIVAVAAGGELTAAGAGTATLTAAYEGLQATCEVTVRAAALAPTRESLPADLTTPAGDALWEVPVLVIRYFPTSDGVNLDTAIAPDFWWDHPLTLAQLDADVLAMNRRAKFALEQGSRFRAYADPGARPSLGYRVVDQVTVYEQTPPGKVIGHDQGDPVWEPDWFAIFERLDVRHYVEDLGVKEVWFWQGGLGRWPSFDPLVHEVADFRGGWESNMASPLTGDISNSNRDNTDLPVYDRTYVVYGYNFRRSQAEAIHDHGHQLESQFAWVNHRQDGNTDLFWKLWRGQDQDGNRVTGRCGDTHCPPNTVDDYDYENPAVVMSDIADWTWDGSGTYVPVSVDTWGGLEWPWPDGKPDFSQRVETQWYMYWMMSMPGHDNGLAYEDAQLTNWWEFIGNWDGAVAAGRGLHGADSLAGAPGPRAGDGAAAMTLAAARANPSSGSFAFVATVDGRDEVNAEVLDVRGRRVRRLTVAALVGDGDGARTVGFTWDGRDDQGRAAATGAYFVRARSGAEAVTRKVMLVR